MAADDKDGRGEREKWDESELNNEELKYYLEVSSRVMQKLVDVTD